MANDASGPKREIAIHILDDGRVVFGDLPPELAEVAQILSGSAPAAARTACAVAPVGSARKARPVAPVGSATSPPAQPPSPNPPDLK